MSFSWVHLLGVMVRAVDYGRNLPAAGRARVHHGPQRRQCNDPRGCAAVCAVCRELGRRLDRSRIRALVPHSSYPLSSNNI